MDISTFKKRVNIVPVLGTLYLLVSLILLCMAISFWVLLAAENQQLRTWVSMVSGIIMLILGYILIRQVKQALKPNKIPKSGFQATTVEGLQQMLELKNKELSRLAQDLIKEQEIRGSSEKAKQIFLVNISHEIRTPMNGIMGFARLLEESLIDEDHHESLQMIIKSADQLMAILNDILDFSRLEAGDINFQQLPFTLKDSVHSIYRMMEQGAKCKDLNFSYEIPDTLPEVLSGDAVRLGQILLNLTSNAIKFTEKGEVKISLKVMKEQADRITIAFKVHDTGIGIPVNKQQSVFDFFEQVTSDTSRRYAGTGLGLSIVKRLVELQGGEVALESVLGKGSDFYFTIDFGKVSDEVKKQTMKTSNRFQQPIVQNGKGIKVLIVEDNPINQLLVIKVLENQGYEITVASNGRIALEEYGKQSFDVILMDLQMPELDGYETTRIIRKMEGDKGEIPIVAMTAHTIEGELEKCLKIGMNDYISKPFNASELYQKIEMIIEKARSSTVTVNKS
ncbi:response regulator [Pedobacter gandavensis]|uniref:histidine kinase n=1 Tax=Pedobacter gandavensis TaxID=2679963 RepID=A0ABR6EVT2_9SPHI|nr:response regulator [Pedobacter gandavensis]MBB2149385.1 response regulator [Pedobacter gandavensis]